MPRRIGTTMLTMTLVSALTVGCMTAAAPGEAQTAPSPASASISAKDKAEGAKYHPQLVAEFGGAMTGPQADYVSMVGKKIALQTGLSNSSSDFTVTLLNSSVDNAFAIPGGYIYATRQLVALMNNEAELGGVLAHEAAHVRAQHSKKRQSAATRNTVFGVVGAVLSGVLLGNSQIGQYLQQGFLQGSQLLTLKYSRDQENESDRLGIQYLKASGYDPRAMSTVLQSLANQNALDARLMGSNAQVPEWASTHPDPASRVRTAATLAGTGGGVLNRDTFLTRISGLAYGDAPEQGYVDGRSFKHSIYKLAFEAPSGFYMMNGTRAVAIGGQSGKGQFTSEKFNGDLNAYVTGVFSAFAQANKAQLNVSTVQRTTVNGIPAAYAVARVDSGNGQQVDVTVFAYQWDSATAYHFMTITQAGSNVFTPMFQSMRRLTTAEAAALKPRKLVVVTVKRGDTLQSLASRMAFTDAPLDRFLVLNGLTSTSKLTVGQKIKIVTY